MGLENGHAAFGDKIKGWRQGLGLSQLQLAVDAGVSPRHLSFIETGRARPSREMVLRLATQMRVPLREQNVLLLAAGFAPAFEQRALDAPEMRSVHNAAALVLANHDPFPAVALDRKRNVVLGNRAANFLSEGVAPALLQPVANAYRLLLHPAGLAPRIVGFPAYSRHLLRRLARDADTSADAELHALLAEVSAYPNVLGAAPGRTGNDDAVDVASSDVALSLRLRHLSGELAFITTLATFGTPFDVTVSELVIECLFPADDFTAHHLRVRAQRLDLAPA